MYNNEDLAIESFIDFCDYMQIDECEIAEEGFFSKKPSKKKRRIEEIKQKRLDNPQIPKLIEKIMNDLTKMLEKSSDRLKFEICSFEEIDDTRKFFRFNMSTFHYEMDILSGDDNSKLVVRKVDEAIDEIHKKYDKQITENNINIYSESFNNDLNDPNQLNQRFRFDVRIVIEIK